MDHPALIFPAAWIALYVGTGLVDHWAQPARCALAKGERTRRGVLACAEHAVEVAAGCMTLLLALTWALDLHPSRAGLAAGIGVQLVTHYAIDRRWTVRAVARWLRREEFHDLGHPRPALVTAGRAAEGRVLVGTRAVPVDAPHLGTGSYQLDQWAHHGCTTLAAVLVALL